jgi:hypothetical protein
MKKTLVAIGGILILVVVGLAIYFSVSIKTLVSTNPPQNLAAVVTAPTNGLVGWWKFDEGTGLTTADSSGNGATGTLTNNPTWVPGQIGTALQFNASNSYVVANNTLPSLTSFTSCAWIKPNFTPTTQGAATVMVRQQEPPSQGDGPRIARIIWLNGSWISDSQNAFAYSASGSVTPFTQNTWHNICFTDSDSNGVSTGQFYWDGSPVTTTLTAGSASIAPNTTSNLPFYIGSAPGGQYVWNGAIDDVRVYNRTLSSTEVSEIYQAGTAPVATTVTTTTTTTTTTPTFSPKIVDSSTGQNITNATITFSGGDLTTARSITATNGTYTITGLSLGKTYNVSIAASGYVTANTTAGISIQNETVTWYLHPPGTTIEILSASTNQVIPGATIVLSAGNLSSPLTLTTNGNGFITTTGLSVGQTYKESISASGYTTTNTTFSVTTANEFALWLLTASTASTANNPTTSFTTTDSSKPVGSNGLAGVTITTTGGNIPVGTPLVLTTASNDSVSTTALASGQTYTVTASAPEYAPATATVIVGQTMKLALTPLAPTGFWITNSQTGATILGATITLSGADLKNPITLTTVAGVNAVTSALTIGQTYNATVSASGYNTLTTTAGIWNAGEVVHWNLTPIAATWPNQINVQVMGANNLPIPDATVSVIKGAYTDTLTSNVAGLASGQVFVPSDLASSGLPNQVIANSVLANHLMVGDTVTVSATGIGFGVGAKVVTVFPGTNNVTINVPPGLPQNLNSKNLIIFVHGAEGNQPTFGSMINYFKTEGVVTSETTFDPIHGKWNQPPVTPGHADFYYFDYAALGESVTASANALNAGIKEIPNIGGYDNIYIITHSIGHLVTRTAVVGAQGSACPSAVNDGASALMVKDPTLQAIYKKSIVLSLNPLLGGGILPAPMNLIESGNQYLADAAPDSAFQDCMFSVPYVGAFNGSVRDYYAWTISGVPDYNYIAGKIAVLNVSNWDIAFGVCSALTGFIPGLCPLPPPPPPPLPPNQGDESFIGVWNYIATEVGYACPPNFPINQTLASFPPTAALDQNWYNLYENGKPPGINHYASYYLGCKLKNEGNIQLSLSGVLSNINLNTEDVHTLLLQYQPLFMTLGLFMLSH